MELEGKLNKDDGNWVPSINSNELIENLIDASVESTTIVKSPIINSKISSNTNDSTDVFIVMDMTMKQNKKLHDLLKN